MAMQRLCRLEDIADGRSMGFEQVGDHSIFAVRRGDEVHVYENRCPHAASPLNWRRHHFLTRDRERILCSAHGARFAIESGVCTDGPCPGARLTAVPAQVRDGEVWVAD